MAEKGERIIRLSRRVNVKPWQKVVVTVVAMLLAFLLCGIISEAADPGSFGEFYELFFKGSFISGDSFLTLLWDSAFLFLIAIALTPVFKMKFWNIGAEGQCIMGGLGALIGLYFIAPHVPLVIGLLIELLLAVIFAVIWTVIPAIFKAFFNTNETLFTLMMNYVAMGIASAFILANKNTATGTIDELYSNEHFGWIPIMDKFNNSYIVNIIIVVAVAALVWVYLKFTKHGYEISVVGGSQNTARYVGINVKWVILRTIIVTGVICGIAGFLCVAGNYHTLTIDAIGGRGFTAIMICWIGNFSVPLMGLYSVLISIVSTGCKNAASWLSYSDKLSSISVALFFITLIISTFFINFKVNIRWPEKMKVFFEKLFKKKEKVLQLGDQSPLPNEDYIKEDDK